MKKYMMLLVMTVLMTAVFGQESALPPVKKFSTGISIFNDIWKGDYKNMTPRTISQGIEVYALYNIPMEHTPLIFSVGAGIGVHNLFSDAMLQLDSARNYQFVKIKDMTVNGKSIDYKKNKLTVSYFDFPFEFRYKNEGGFKAALGMKFGFVLESHTKYKGDDYTGATTDQLKIKVKDIRNLEKWRYGVTARLGYKAIELYGYYGLSKIFKKDQGPDLYPISIGISLRPF